MRPRATHWAEDHFADFLTGFELPVPRIQVTREGTGPAVEQAADINPETNSQELTKWDDNKVEQPSKVLVEPHRSKRGHMPKRQFELDPDKKYQYPQVVLGYSSVLPSSGGFPLKNGGVGTRDRLVPCLGPSAMFVNDHAEVV